MKTNTKVKAERKYTAGGSKASFITKEQELRRSILTNMLGENNFYEDGKTVNDRIAELITFVKPEKVADLALSARNDQKLRHVPLFIAREMAKHAEYRPYVRNLLFNIIQRPDELSEFLAMYWKGGKCAIANSVKKGLADAFGKFNEYSLSKYNQDNAIKLRDVLFMVHAKPKDKAQELLWKKLVDGKLAIPDTWEVNLSAGADKKETFTRLIKEKKLGALAMLKNLRNMVEAGVDDEVIKQGIMGMKTDKVLPFRFITAARYAPRFESVLEAKMLENVKENYKKLDGKTILVLDTSGSMCGQLSGKSELNRLDAAKAIAILIRELCDDIRIYITAGNDSSRIHSTGLVPDRHGFALCDAIEKVKPAHGGGGVFLVQCMDYIYSKEKDADRIIVITDEQDCDTKLRPEECKVFGNNFNYLINIASEKNGVGYKNWTHIDGFSESVIDYMLAYETLMSSDNE